MIININKAILHILDAVSGNAVYSDFLLDTENPTIVSYIENHIERIYEDASMRTGEFSENSGIFYHIKQYTQNDINLETLSQQAAERIYEIISGCDNIHSCDILVCDFTAGEKRELAILKFDYKMSHVHKISYDGSKVKTELLHNSAILPSISNKISEGAFINLDNYSIRYKGKKVAYEGEKIDLFADGLLECVYDISSKESFNAVQKIAKKVAKEYGSDGLNEAAKMKEYVKNTAVVNDTIDTGEVAKRVFENSPSAREEFLVKTQKAMVPETFEVNSYITKRINKNIKLITDNGIELSFPAEFYQNSENLIISNNEDGTISIQINNVNTIDSK